MYRCRGVYICWTYQLSPIVVLIGGVAAAETVHTIKRGTIDLQALGISAYLTNRGLVTEE